MIRYVFTPEGFQKLKNILKEQSTRELQYIQRCSQVITPPEQDELIAIGSGAVIERDGKRSKVFFGGYRVDNPPKEHTSIQSPLGNLLLGAKKGEFRTLKVGDKFIIIKVINIVPYSQIATFLQDV